MVEEGGASPAGPTAGALHATHGRTVDPLTGGHERTVDDKGRVVLPAGDWRDTFAGKAWIGPWKNGSLALWNAESFKALLDKVAEQEHDRVVPDGTIEAFRQKNPVVPIDAQGRFTIPPQLRELRDIPGGGVVFMEGQGDRLEIRLISRAARQSDQEYDATLELFDHR